MMVNTKMREDTETLSEIILAADQFCSAVEARNKDVAPNLEEKELKAKLGLCRSQLAYLQNIFNEDRLKLDDPLVREGFRHLITAMLWIAFYCRTFIDFRLFRKVILIESIFANLLIHQGDMDEASGPAVVTTSVGTMPSPENQMSPVSSDQSLDSKAKLTRQRYILLWATLCILVLNLIVAVVGPKWKQRRLERPPNNSSPALKQKTSQ